MDNKKMGQFISELRKSHQMTQKQLAEKLNVTDKAVSKCERGLSGPDISLLAPISNILNVTTSELLNGKRSGMNETDVETTIDNALQYADKSIKIKRSTLHSAFAASFSMLLLLGILVCTICDLALSGTFTWSLIVISSIIFTWLSFFSVIWLGKRGIVYSLIAISILTVPFLYALDNSIVANFSIMPIGIRMSAIAIVYFWAVFLLFKKLKTRRLVISAVCLFLVIPVQLLVNLSLTGLFNGETLFDVWDAFDFSIIILAGLTLLVIDFWHVKKKNEA